MSDYNSKVSALRNNNPHRRGRVQHLKQPRQDCDAIVGGEIWTRRALKDCYNFSDELLDALVRADQAWTRDMLLRDRGYWKHVDSHEASLDFPAVGGAQALSTSRTYSDASVVQPESLKSAAKSFLSFRRNGEAEAAKSGGASPDAALPQSKRRKPAAQSVIGGPFSAWPKTQKEQTPENYKRAASIEIERLPGSFDEHLEYRGPTAKPNGKRFERSKPGPGQIVLRVRKRTSFPNLEPWLLSPAPSTKTWRLRRLSNNMVLFEGGSWERRSSGDVWIRRGKSDRKEASDCDGLANGEHDFESQATLKVAA